MNMKLLSPVMSLIILTLCVTQACAQRVAGSGEFGGNRRVTTPEGYGGVRGTFTEPTFNNPFNATQEANTDKPQMYLGVRVPGVMEVDAGFTWIPRYTQTGALETNRNHWGVFRRINGGTQSLVRAARSTNLWLVGRGNLDDTDAMLIVRGDANRPVRNHFRILIQRGNTVLAARNVEFPTPPNPQTVASNMVSKRVIAMTQAGTEATPSHLDGSFMRGAAFTEGRVAKIKFNTAEGTFERDGDWTYWDNADGNARHYYPWGRRGQPVGAVTTNASERTRDWVIDSPDHHRYKGDGDLEGRPSNESTAFTSETINIDMIGRVDVKARRAKPKSR